MTSLGTQEGAMRAEAFSITSSNTSNEIHDKETEKVVFPSEQ